MTKLLGALWLSMEMFMAGRTLGVIPLMHLSGQEGLTGYPTRIVHPTGRSNPRLTLCSAPRVLPVLFVCPNAT